MGEYVPKVQVYLNRDGCKIPLDKVPEHEAGQWVKDRYAEQRSHNDGKLSGHYTTEPLVPRFR